MHHGRPVVPCRMRALIAVHVPAQHKVDLSLPKERLQMCGQIASRAWRASFACVLVPRRRGVQWAVHLNNQPGANKAAWRRIGRLHLRAKPAMLRRPRVVRFFCVEHHDAHGAKLEGVVG